MSSIVSAIARSWNQTLRPLSADEYIKVRQATGEALGLRMVTCLTARRMRQRAVWAAAKGLSARTRADEPSEVEGSR